MRSVAELAEALAAGRELDLHGAVLPADRLAAVLTGAGVGPLRLRGAAVTGVLELVGARVERPGRAARLHLHATRPTCGWPSSPGSR